LINSNRVIGKAVSGVNVCKFTTQGEGGEKFRVATFKKRNVAVNLCE
jgi:hypothetical protein